MGAKKIGTSNRDEYGVLRSPNYLKKHNAALARTQALQQQRIDKQNAKIAARQAADRRLVEARNATDDPTQSMRYMRDLAGQQTAYEKANNLPITQQDFTVGNRMGGPLPGTPDKDIRIINGVAYGPGQRPQFLNQLKSTAIPNVPQAPGKYTPNQDFLNGTGNLTDADIAGLSGEYPSGYKAPGYLGLAPNSTNAQQRAAIASMALSSDDPRYRDPETLGYYRKLTLEATPDSSGNIPITGAEQQYLSQGYGSKLPQVTGNSVNRNAFASSVERLYRGDQQ